MKQFLLTIAVFLLVGTMVYSQQQSAQPTSAQTRQTAQQFLSQGQSNASQFEQLLADLHASNTSNANAGDFNRIRAEITRLENAITTEEHRIKDNLDSGLRISPEILNRVERLINQHRSLLGELEELIAGMQ